MAEAEGIWIAEFDARLAEAEELWLSVVNARVAETVRTKIKKSEACYKSVSGSVKRMPLAELL